MPDLDPAHLTLGATALLSLIGNAAQGWASRRKKEAAEAETEHVREDTASRAYQHARADLGDCREELEEVRSSLLILSTGLHGERAERKALERACAERDLKAATERERDRKLIDGLREEMDGLRRSITGDAR